MNWLDVVIIVTVLITTFLGLKIGLLRALFLFAGFVIGAIVSSEISILPASLMEKFISNPGLRYIISFTATFLLIFIGINVAGGIIYKLMSFTPLKWIDSWIGVGLGFLAGIMLACLIVTYLAEAQVSGSDKWINESFLAPIIKEMGSQIFRGFSKERPSVVLYQFLE